MPDYSYVGYSQGGAKKRGKVEAADRPGALKLLRASGIKVLDLSEVSAQRNLSAISFDNILPARANLEQLFASIALLLDAGLSLDRALKAIVSDGSNTANSAMASSIADNLSNGKPPAEAFELAEAGGPEVTALIASGEQSGKLPLVFSSIAKDLEQKRIQKEEITGAIAYPAFLMLMMGMSLMVVTFVLVPAILPIFEGSDQEIPVMIGILDALRGFLISWGGIVGLITLVAVLIALRSGRTSQWKKRFSTVVLMLPSLGALVRKRGLARYLDNLSMLLGNGVQMHKALELASDTCPVKAYRQKLETVREHVLNGMRLPSAFEDARIFPAAIVSLAAIGDESNKLPIVLGRAAKVLNDEASRSQNRLLALLTPVITILMGLLIGGLVISVMNALLSVNDLSLQ